MPLLPFGIEKLFDGRTSSATLTVGAAVYVMVLGSSSRNMLLFGISVALGIVYTLMFAFVKMNNLAVVPMVPRIVVWSISFFVLFHGIERLNRHVFEREPYWEFARVN